MKIGIRADGSLVVRGPGGAVLIDGRRGAIIAVPEGPRDEDTDSDARTPVRVPLAAAQQIRIRAASADSGLAIWLELKDGRLIELGEVRSADSAMKLARTVAEAARCAIAFEAPDATLEHQVFAHPDWLDAAAVPWIEEDSLVEIDGEKTEIPLPAGEEVTAEEWVFPGVPPPPLYASGFPEAPTETELPRFDPSERAITMEVPVLRMPRAPKRAGRPLRRPLPRKASNE